MTILTETRKVKSKTEYWCYLDGWVTGREWNGGGYPQQVCEHCGMTLDDDLRGHHALESIHPDVICRCGHLASAHAPKNGQSHPPARTATGACGCVFSREEAEDHPME